MRFRKQFVSFFMVLCIILSTGYFLSTAKLRFIRYTPMPCPESTEELSNPYIGWYQVQRYLLSDTLSFDLDMITGLEQKPGLVLLEINLQNYADCPVTSAGLQNLDTLFHCWETTRKQLIVRFLYDWDGDARAQEPEELSLILEHMSQTVPVLNRYSDSVYILQGIFIGSWGEMHGSNHANEEDMRTLMQHLNTLVSPDIFLAVRTPEQWRSMTGQTEPLSAGQASGHSLAARLGLFNDGMLGSETDLNTYQESSSDHTSDATGKRSREEEIRFQSLLCDSVPNGGEVIIDNPHNDFAPAVTYLRDAHVSYLNGSYDEAVLSKWQADRYRGEGPFQGMNGRDYIGRHLGYRYVLRSSDCTSPDLPGEAAQFSAILENVGFSGSYVPFDLSLSLVAVERKNVYTIPIQTDIRSLSPGTQLMLSAPLELPDYMTGTYQLCLKITDPATGCEVRLANDTAHTAYGHAIGNLEIRSFPKFSQ
ncbi:MAG: DUF4832 domain-containing protein [Lachnospiraceae bacterium]|nr:DUF4832 domain-containing protein [Lachnospiraceae bacterium]